MSIGNALAVSGVLRRNHYRAGLRTLLLEAADTNRCPRSEDLSTWTKSSGTGSATGGQTDPLGGLSAFKLDDQDAAVQVSWTSANFVAYAGAATSRGVSFFAKADTSASGTVDLNDVTAANTVKLRVTVTNTAGVLTAAITFGSGTVVAVLPSTDQPGHYRVLAQVTGLTPADTHNFIVRPAGIGVGNLGAMIFWGFVAHDLVGPAHSYVQNNTAGSSTCDRDLLQIPWNVAPGALSLYIKYRETGNQLHSLSGASPIPRMGGIWGGTTDIVPRLMFLHNGANVRLQNDRVSGTDSSTTAGTPTFVYGDVIEVFGWVYPDGTVQVGVSVNGAAPIIGTRSVVAGGFPAAWSPDGLVASQRFNPGAFSGGLQEWIAGGVFPGTLQLAEMQALAAVIG